jgi:dTDP-4-dehydrorhamnose 3,5-epimerase-like enzyme
MSDEMVVIPLDESTDSRGLSFSILEDEIARIGAVRDVHIAAIRPGCTRGNHYHARRGELIAVVFRDAWSLHWDTGEETETYHRSFSGRGGVLIVPPLGWSHAVRNDGGVDMWIFAASDRPYDRHDSDEIRRDAIRRVVTD